MEQQFFAVIERFMIKTARCGIFRDAEAGSESEGCAPSEG